MTEANTLIILFFFFAFLAVPAYYLYLSVVNPWSREKLHRKLHEFGGGEWVSTEEGGMGIDTENWILYIYKWDDPEGSDDS